MRNTDSPVPNLTTFTRWGRSGVKYLSVGIVVFLVGRVLLSTAIDYWLTINPPPPPPPTVGFGALPSIVFPPSTNTPSSYQLETASGGFPSFPDRAKVFLMPKKAPSLLDDQQVKQIAAKYDFVFEPQVLDATTYRFTKTEPLNSILDLDIVDHVFTLDTDFLDRPELNLKSDLPTNFDAANTVKSFAQLAGNLDKDIATASAEISYLKSSGGNLIPALSASDADFIRADINRVPVDGEFPMFTQQGRVGVISAIIAGYFSGNDSIVKAHNFYYPIDYDSVHTYPLREVKNAWKSLQAGEGLVVNPGLNETAVIRQVSLGYYDDMDGQEYLQPIYVFSGDDSFLGFAAAIDPRYLQTQGLE